MHVKTDCKNTLARAYTREKTREKQRPFFIAAKNAGRGVLFSRIDSAGCKRGETPRLYPVEIYETNERVRNITVSRILRVVWRGTRSGLKCFKPVTQLGHRVRLEETSCYVVILPIQ